MKKIFLLVVITLSFNSILAQETKTNSADDLLKETIHTQNKKAVLNFTMKDFEKLFFEFSHKTANDTILLTKEQYYTYTVKIALFSDRLATLYPKEKEVAVENKKQWLSKNYEDYLLSKQTPKK